MEMKLHLDWSDYENAGQGDAYAGIPAQGGNFARAVSVCISDKRCQTLVKGVMCPSFRITGEALHSPGGRVAVLKEALNGRLGDQPFVHARMAEALALCVGCKGCRRECANQVDMATIRIEALAQRNAIAGAPLRDRLFAGLPRWLAYRGLLRRLVRLRNRHGWLARLGERWLGISARRPLPEPAAEPYREMVPSSPAMDDGRDVILFVDTYARHFEPEIAEAALAVLGAAGYRAHVLLPATDDPEPARPLCCGRTYLSLGQVEAARREATRMLSALRPALATGTPVIGLEPSCILSLRDEHLRLGLGPEAARLAKQVWLFEEFVAREVDRKRFALGFRPLPSRHALVHGHCHQKAVGAMKSLRKVLRLIPDLQFEFIDASCCGGAGSFAFEAEHHDISARMAEAELMPIVRAAAPDTELLANGFSCRHQIEANSGRRARHVALLLRDALPAGQ
jgi:glycerol-3-phosphate dehydrogenase subunit C